LIGEKVCDFRDEGLRLFLSGQCLRRWVFIGGIEVIQCVGMATRGDPVAVNKRCVYLQISLRE
jgi:hypothetical protein